jgi:kynurenine formamidase
MGENVKRVDLSHTIEDGMITYKGLPAPVICDFMSREESRSRYAPGTEFHIGRIDMVANTGTYVDSPFHRYEAGDDLSMLSLDSIAHVECLVVRIARDVKSIGPDHFGDLDFAGKAVLVDTGWDRHWRTDEYFEDHPHLTEAAATRLVEGKARVVGIDSFNIDSIATGARPVHTVLLRHGVPIIEHMCNLAAVPDTGAFLTAAPAPVKGMGTFPVRAFAIVAAGGEGAVDP